MTQSHRKVCKSEGGVVIEGLLKEKVLHLLLPKSGRHFELKVGFMWIFLGKQCATVKVKSESIFIGFG